MKNYLFHLFTPQESNNHRARLLHPKILFLFLLFFLLAPTTRVYLNSKSVLGASTSITIQDLVLITNQEREKNGLPDLKENSLLDSAAQNKSKDMFSKNYWAHIAPDGTTPWFFIKQSGYDYIYAGENLAKGFNSSSDVVTAWMNSPTHRENVLSENFQDVGFSVAEGSINGEETTLVVEEFGGTTLVPVAQKVTKEAPKTVQEKSLPTAGEKTQLKPTTIVRPQVLSFPKIQSTNLSQNIVYMTMFFLLAVLAIDMFFAYKRKIIRLAGHNLDHLLLFLFMIILATTILQGSII